MRVGDCMSVCKRARMVLGSFDAVFEVAVDIFAILRVDLRVLRCWKESCLNVLRKVVMGDFW